MQASEGRIQQRGSGDKHLGEIAASPDRDLTGVVMKIQQELLITRLQASDKASQQQPHQ
jgi:hypothetical protein